MMRRIDIIIATIPIFSGIDAAATLYWIKMGYAIEGNPFVIPMIEMFSQESFIAWKITGIAILIILIMFALKKDYVGPMIKAFVDPALLIVAAVYAFVIVRYHLAYAMEIL